MKYLKIAIAAVAFGLMIALIVNPTRYAQSVTDGLLMYVVSVLPSMLPFFFLSGLLTGTGVAGKLSRVHLTKPLFHAPDEGLYVMLMSFLSGYPVGAKLTAEMYQNGVIDAVGAKKMIPFTSATGPMFVVGAVGSQILHDYRAGLCILAAHYLATVLNGFLYRGKRQKYGFCDNIASPVKMDKLLWETAYNTVVSLLVSCVYIVMFNMIADVLSDLGLMRWTSALLSHLGLTDAVGTAMAYGLTEMTRGCVMLSATGLPVATTAPLCCLLVSFGGFGVCLQSVAYLSKCHVNPLYYLLTKCTQAAIATGLCTLFCLAL